MGSTPMGTSGNNGIPRNQQREEGAVKRRGRATAPQGRSEHITPADDGSLSNLVAAQRPEKAARLLLAIAAPLAPAQPGLDDARKTSPNFLSFIAKPSANHMSPAFFPPRAGSRRPSSVCV